MLRSQLVRRSVFSAAACGTFAAMLAGCSGTNLATLPRAAAAPAAAAAEAPLGTAVPGDRLQRIVADLRRGAVDARAASGASPAPSPSAAPNPDGLAASAPALSFATTGTPASAHVAVSSNTFGIVVPVVASATPCVVANPLGAFDQRKNASDPSYYATFTIVPLRKGTCTLQFFEIDAESLQTRVLSELDVPVAVGVQPSPSPSPAPQTSTVYAVSSATQLDAYDGASSGAVTPKASWTIGQLKYGDVGLPSIASDPANGSIWLSDGYTVSNYLTASASGPLAPVANLALSTSSFVAESGTVQGIALDAAHTLYATESSSAGDVFAFSINGATSGALAPAHTIAPANMTQPSSIAANGTTVAVMSADCADALCDDGTLEVIRLFPTPLANGGIPFKTITLGALYSGVDYGLAMDRAGNLYVLDVANNKVDFFPAGDGTYGQGMTASIAPASGSIIAIAVDRANDLYTMNVANYQMGPNNPVQTATIMKYAPNAGAKLSSFGPVQAATIAAY